MQSGTDCRNVVAPFKGPAFSTLRFAEPRFNSHHVAQVNRRLRQAHIDTILGLLAAIEAKDSYTHQHSIAVSFYADRLAKLLGLSALEESIIHVAALLHDVGKIGIPDAILKKPGRLSEAEFNEMKAHSRIGANMLLPISFLRRETLLVLHHHEWFDGTGYPYGLRGTAIPLGSRVLQVADSIDAMLSPRSYKPGRDVDHVIAELTKGKGRQFDPAIAQTAASWLSKHPEQLAQPI